MQITKTARALCIIALAAAIFASGSAPPPADDDFTFTIKDAQNGDCGDGEGWISNAEAVYRLCTMWRFGQPWSEPLEVLAEHGIKPADLKMSANTPRELFRQRGSLAALRPGERLQFYLSEMSGTSVEKKSGVKGVMRTVRDGIFESRDSRGGVHTDKEEEGPKSANPAAEFVRTPDGGVLWFAQGDVPAAGMTDFMGTVGVTGGAGWRQVFVFTFTNEELANWATVQKTNHGVVRASEGGGSIDYRAELSVKQRKLDAPEVEVSVDEAIYRQWLPEGNLDAPDQPGNRLQIRVVAHEPGNPSKPRRVKLSLALPYVSEQKGVSMNWPLPAAMNVGLRFRKEDFSGDGPLVFTDEKHVESRDLIEQASVTVHAYDFGAYGTLRITAKDEAGNEAKILTRGAEGTDLTIPRDDNHNRIADAWEEKYGLGASATATLDEDDTPSVGAGQYRGDGLTLYEEYRGFRIAGKHQRTDPRRMDLFVCDDSDMAGAGIKLFESATGIRTWKVEHEELLTKDGAYVINRNFAPGTHAVDQHGVLIVDRKVHDPEAIPSTDHGRFGPPRFTKYIQIPAGGDYSKGDSLSDIAHELSHAVGLTHHGDGTLARFWTWKQETDGRWQLYEQEVGVDSQGNPNRLPRTTPVHVFFEKDLHEFRHGEELPAHFTKDAAHNGWLLYLGSKNSEFSGDQECLMRYYDKQAYASESDPDHVRYIPDPAQWKARTRLCKSREGTGVNAASHKPQSRYGDAAAGRGNCRDQLRVSDKYGSRSDAPIGAPIPR